MRSPVRIYFILAFGLSWGIGGIALVLGRWMPESQPFSTSNSLYYLAAYSVSFTGIALTARYEGREGLRRLCERLIPWRSQFRWYLTVALGYAAITGIALQVAGLFQLTLLSLPSWSVFLHTLLFSIVRDPGPVGEEFGWRGFALPQLLKRYSPLNASLLLALIHAAWHIPLFFIPGMPQTQVSFPFFTLGVISIAIFDTAIYFRTGANLLLAILIHLLANVCGGIALNAHAFVIFTAAEGIIAALIVLAGGLRPTPQQVVTNSPKS